ncbi:type II CAAX endopeptidase family protein [Saccharopolyspora cebuensis]|uniref:CPBP family intramembrane glutamic endopeptidase n=1 Tax=Saccharopolyspora cebuensis TaxID=418759 RepID=UPI0031E8BE67
MSAPANPHRGDLILFMAATFTASWAAWAVAIALGGPAANPAALVPHLLGAFGPMVGALVLRIRRARRGAPVPEHAVRFRPAHLVGAPLLLVLASATVLGAVLLAHVAGGPGVSAEGALAAVQGSGGLAVFLVNMVVAGPLAEEPGWRGTAYPRLRASMGRFRIGLVLGVIWAVWHLPLFFLDGTVQHQLGLLSPSGVLFAVSSIPMTMLVCCAYERAGVLAAIAVHFATNTTMVLLGVHAPVAQAMIMGFQVIVVAVLLATQRRGSGPTAEPAARPQPAVG